MFTKKKKKRLKLINESKIKNFIKTYFDINNIFIYNDSIKGYKKITNAILKIYCYINQLGYRFLKQISLTNKALKLKKEIKRNFTHYFNILLCGIPGSGKSTFINILFGEKKAYAIRSKLFGTNKYYYYIHNSYPIRIIDSSPIGTEMETSKNSLMIYKNHSENIILDDTTNDIFKFYNDRRNNIHLLLYFNIYNGKYGISPIDIPLIHAAFESKIPIMLIINKCGHEIFEKKTEKKILESEIKEEIKVANFEIFENLETYLINCIEKKGIDILLNGIYEKFKNYKI